MDTMRLESVGSEPDLNQENPDLNPKTPDLNPKTPDLNEESVGNPDLKADDPESNPEGDNSKLDPENVTNIGITTEDNKNSNGAAGLLVPGNNGSKSRKN